MALLLLAIRRYISVKLVLVFLLCSRSDMLLLSSPGHTNFDILDFEQVDFSPFLKDRIDF